MASPITPLHKKVLIVDFLFRILPFAPFVQIEHRKTKNKKKLKCLHFLCCPRYPMLIQITLPITFSLQYDYNTQQKLAKIFQISDQ